ncbi:hypothetical protein GCM10029964_052890 [Kibdelosporangium lantanae]
MLSPGLAEPPSHAGQIAAFVHDVAGVAGRPQDEPDTSALAADQPDSVREDATIELLESTGLVPQGMRDEVRLRLQSYLDTVYATLTCTSRPFDGVVLQCVASEGGGDYSAGWDRLASSVVRRDVPGSHYTILQAPNVDRTAAVVQEFLADRTRAGRTER